MYYKQETGYLKLLEDTLYKGELRNTRNGNVISQFACMINFKDITQSFPLLTTKKVFFRGVVEELLWFLRGSTSAKELQEKNIHIWDGNSTREFLNKNGLDYEEGELGPVYGWQWRKFGCRYPDGKDGCDQLEYIIKELLKEDNSRRAVLSAWNPKDLNKMALPPCHMIYTFFKNTEGLSCHMTMRSSDLFLGLPFNIASTALLTSIIAHVLHLPAKDISLSLCDAHIYEEHISAVKIQLERDTYELPQIKIKKNAPDANSIVSEKIKWIEELQYDDFELLNYKCHESIQARML
jgi:dihydrofolate reductase/thymidylate synthase